MSPPAAPWPTLSGARSSALKGDRELTVRLNDSAAVAAYRRETPASMTLKIDKLRAKMAWQKTIVPLASAKVVAARQLVSGNIRLTVRSTREAKLLRTHQEGHTAAGD
ncbi:hypothetical protein N7493_000782 [Penicillium malachiteum]|uniref:Uncharacterized protein n=1 Tax=Penicillium malachiteum TaxID=1324776 RepID=A0AAD6HX31_9EURO|nr:hypothetical protein N7493_000782 [Penicillium malachiteum]